MIKVLMRLLTTLYVIFLVGCGGGSSGGSSSSTVYGTITVSPSTMTVPNGQTSTATLTLNNSSGVGNVIVLVSSTDSAVASVNVSQCVVSSNNPTCQVIITGEGLGSTQINLSSSFSANTYTIESADVTVNDSLDFTTVVQGLSNTIYNNQIYPARFRFTNTSASSVSLGSSTVSMPSPISWTLESDTCSNETIESNATCVISGNVSIANQLTGNTISITLNSGSSSYLYQMDAYAVAYVSGYAALRVQAPAESSGQTGVYFFVDVGGVESDSGAHPIQYTAQGNNTYVGSIITNSSNGSVPSTYTFQLQPGNTVIYTPPMLVGPNLQNAGARIFLSYGGAMSGTAGAQPDIQQSIPYVMPEYNVPSNMQTVLDVSYVNSISVPVAATGTLIEFT